MTDQNMKRDLSIRKDLSMKKNQNTKKSKNMSLSILQNKIMTTETNSTTGMKTNQMNSMKMGSSYMTLMTMTSMI
jgi:hypothetical protein